MRGATAVTLTRFSRRKNFNPRAPCGARPRGGASLSTRSRFQSTRPVRGATAKKAGAAGGGKNFNPRAPCGARHGDMMDPLGGLEFQSTRPVRGATSRCPAVQLSFPISIHAPRAGRDFMPNQVIGHALISIHAPRAGRDQALPSNDGLDHNFNPRAPCGARPASSMITRHFAGFQSTRPVRGATIFFRSLCP